MGFEELKQELASMDWKVRRDACEALGELGDARAVAPLIARLGDNFVYVRILACEALGELGDARAVAPLIERLGDGDWKSRKAACEALGEVGDARAVGPLIERLGDEAYYVRKAVCEALAKLGDGRAVGPLIARLGDKDWRVRAAACSTLGELGDARAVAPLIERLGDKDGDVRAAVCEALGELGDARAVGPLIERLGDGDWHVRYAAYEALGGLGDARAVGPLIERLDEEYMKGFRNGIKAVWDALNKLGERRLVRAFESFYNGDDERGRELQRRVCEGDIRVSGALLAICKDFIEGQYFIPDRDKRAACVLRRMARAVRPVQHRLLCSNDLTRFELRRHRNGLRRSIPAVVCRVCGKAAYAVPGIETATCVLDDRGGETMFGEGEVRANWNALVKLFDFDRIEIVRASDYDVEKFCIQVANDPDRWRSRRYKKIPCHVSNGCHLAENTLRILRAAFGDVTVDGRARSAE